MSVQVRPAQAWLPAVEGFPSVGLRGLASDGRALAPCRPLGAVPAPTWRLAIGPVTLVETATLRPDPTALATLV